MKNRPSSHSPVEKFAAEHGIKLAINTGQDSLWPTDLAKIVDLDGKGTISQHVSEAGADYLFSRIDYINSRSERVTASQMIAKILAGHRTKLAYWTESAPTKQLTVHRGEGDLVVGWPLNTSYRAFNTSVFHLDPEVTPAVTLAPGRFYTFEASIWTREPLVVSGLYESSLKVDWKKMEIPLKPGQETVEAPEGTVKVPDEFRLRNP